MFQAMQTTLYQTELPSPIGTLVACATDEGLSMLQFADALDLESSLDALITRLHANISAAQNQVLNATQKQLAAYFEGQLQQFEIPLKMSGTPFQMQVWKTLLTIPYGKTCTYAAEAAAMGRPTAMRAVGSANGRNPICIVVPCHRVVAAGGSLGGYTGGLKRKEFLLNLEKLTLQGSRPNK
jgi:AraC family transcriptional regulator of adaptative response/methylated-DNA-[protein]-cysteine methyltransferase